MYTNVLGRYFSAKPFRCAIIDKNLFILNCGVFETYVLQKYQWAITNTSLLFGLTNATFATPLCFALNFPWPQLWILTFQFYYVLARFASRLAVIPFSWMAKVVCVVCKKLRHTCSISTIATISLGFPKTEPSLVSVNKVQKIF